MVCLRMEAVRIFYGHLNYFTAIWYTLLSFGNVVTIGYIFNRFEIFCVKKNLATLLSTWIVRQSDNSLFPFVFNRNL
jgi:hypothetical protein